MTPARQRPARGVSLIEALVALAIMAFGMLGLVGLQTSMRSNADAAKQRSEAVRIAQERLEQWRGYGTLAEYSTIADAAASAASTSTTNTSYTWEADVTPDLPVDNPLKDVQITVRWTDRASEAQSLTLTTRVAAMSPVINAATGTPANGDVARRPSGRNQAIPPQATEGPNGTSRFVPPGLSNVGWVFNNVTGTITSQCDASFATCTPVNLLLLSGYVNFDTAAAPHVPNPELPAGTRFADPITVTVVGVSPGPTQTVTCAVDYTVVDTRYVPYYCALELTLETAPTWSGRVWFGTPASAPLAAASAAASAAEYRVCRYTTVENDTPASVPNGQHPLIYQRVSTSLANQNYLIVNASTGTAERRCPDDVTSTLFINGKTWDQQPARTDPAPP